MLLAAAVSTAASSEAITASAQPCLTWAMSAGAPLAAQNARVFLAQKAANEIRALDRVSGVQPLPASAFEAEVNLGRGESNDLAGSHTLSSHQHSAP